MSVTFMNICRENTDLVKIGQKIPDILQRHFFVAGDINSSFKQCCATHSVFVLFTCSCPENELSRFHCNNGYVNVPQFYIVRTLPNLMKYSECI
jgi:hypothetical protein